MKFTDGMFTFPTRVYDSFSVYKSQKEEELTDSPQQASWVEGRARVPLNEIRGFCDFFSKGREPEDVLNNGFDGTMVFTANMGEFISTWSSTIFEKKLNEFADRYENTLNAYVEQKLQEKIQAQEAQLQKEIEIAEEEEENRNLRKKGFFANLFKK